MTEEPSPQESEDEEPSTDERSGTDRADESNVADAVEYLEGADDGHTDDGHTDDTSISTVSASDDPVTDDDTDAETERGVDGDRATADADRATADADRESNHEEAVSDAAEQADSSHPVRRKSTNQSVGADVATSDADADAATADADAAVETKSDSDGAVATEADADDTGTEADATDPAETDTGDDGSSVAEQEVEAPSSDVPEDVRSYARFSKVDGATYERVNGFLRDRTYVTAREWAMARLCADFRTETGVEMTKIGENLPELVPFMTDTYSPQAVNQARTSFEQKVTKAGATFLYGAMCDFFTAEELDDLMYEVTEVAKFLLEVEGVELTVDEELAAEERISSVMREVRRASDELRHDGVECPSCGHEFSAGHEHAHE